MGYKMKGSPAKLGSIQGTTGHASALKMHKPGHDEKVKMLEGTTIFGKSPKEFLKQQSGYNTIKGIYDKISGSKKKAAKKATKKSTSKGVREAASEGAQALTEGGKMGLKESMKRIKKPGKLAKKDSMKKIARPAAKKLMRKVTRDLKMKTPYKKPVGPRATKKNIKGETHNEAAVRTEGSKKLQTVRRKGLVPGSQKFSDKAFLKSQNESEVKRSDLDAKGKNLYDSKRKKPPTKFWATAAKVVTKGLKGRAESRQARDEAKNKGVQDAMSGSIGKF